MLPALREYWKERDKAKNRNDFKSLFIRELSIVFNENPILRPKWTEALNIATGKSDKD